MMHMAKFESGDLELHYDEYGTGFPVLLIAPGGMKSEASFWESTPWNPIEQLSDKFRVIAMDQRNAGRSTGPITESDSWTTYTQDQLDLLDHYHQTNLYNQRHIYLPHLCLLHCPLHHKRP